MKAGTSVCDKPNESHSRGGKQKIRHYRAILGGTNIGEDVKVKEEKTKVVPIWEKVTLTVEEADYANLDRALKTVCKKLKMESFTMHSLRHTFATRCIEAEMKPKTLQYILGHSRIEMTMNLYVHVTDETVIKEMEKFELAI